MRYRRQVFFTDMQKSDLWDRWKRGESMSSIRRGFDPERELIFGPNISGICLGLRGDSETSHRPPNC